jgi:hypothetical protein
MPGPRGAGKRNGASGGGGRGLSRGAEGIHPRTRAVRRERGQGIQRVRCVVATGSISLAELVGDRIAPDAVRVCLKYSDDGQRLDLMNA